MKQYVKITKLEDGVGTKIKNLSEKELGTLMIAGLSNTIYHTLNGEDKKIEEEGRPKLAIAVACAMALDAAKTYVKNHGTQEEFEETVQLSKELYDEIAPDGYKKHMEERDEMKRAVDELLQAFEELTKKKK